VYEQTHNQIQTIDHKQCLLLTDFQNFVLLESVWNLLQNPYDNTRLTLGMLLHYLGKLKIRIFLQIFSKYGRKCKQIAFWAKRWIPISRDISPTALWVCGLSSWLKTKLLNFLNVFFSAGTARSPAAWRPVNCAYVPQLFQQLINITLCPVCLMKFVCQPLCCVPLQI